MHPIFDGVKAVFVDVDDTLLDFRLCAAEALQRACAENGISFESAFVDIFLTINAEFWHGIERGERTRDEVYRVRFDTIFPAWHIQTDVPAAAFDTCFRRYLNLACEPVEGAPEALKCLAMKFPVYAASNATTKQQVKRLTDAGMMPLLAGMFVSDAVGADKPNKEFFDVCFSSLPGLLPSDTVMLGDSPTADIVGAKRYGMRTLWLDRRKGQAACAEADVTVTSMSDVVKLLDGR